MVDAVPDYLKVMQSVNGKQFWPNGSGDPQDIHNWLDYIAQTYPEMRAYCDAAKREPYFAWCGLAVAYCMARAGYRPPFGADDKSRFLWAFAWRSWGRGLATSATPAPGDVVVFDFGGGDQHVTLFLKDAGGGLWECLGGNQTHQVKPSPFPSAKAVAVRHPDATAAVAPDPQTEEPDPGPAPIDESWNPYSNIYSYPTGEIAVPGLTSEVIAAAQASQRNWGVPASVTLAQYGLESGWGSSMPAGSNNPFGIKALAGQPSVMSVTREEQNGRSFVTTQAFRKYGSLAEAFDDHGRLLNRSYPEAMANKGDPYRFVDGLKRYATASNYISTLKQIISERNLTQYDKGGSAAPLSGDTPVLSGTPDLSAELADALKQIFGWTLPVDGGVAGPLLKTGDSGSNVKVLQETLKSFGYQLGATDGIFGPLTEQALLAFQSDNDAPTTGIADGATWAAFKTAQPRALALGRTNATLDDLRELGSRTINQADNTTTAGIISGILGVLGLGNSIAVGASGANTGVAPKSLETVAPLLNQLIEKLQPIVAAPDKALPAGAGAEVATLTKQLQSLLTGQAPASGDLATILTHIRDLLPKGGNSPDITAYIDSVLATLHANVAPQVNTVLDFFAQNPQIGGTAHTVLELAAGVAGSFVPGFGGSLLALGLGAAATLFSSQIKTARLDDHRSGANLSR